MYVCMYVCMYNVKNPTSNLTIGDCLYDLFMVILVHIFWFYHVRTENI